MLRHRFDRVLSREAAFVILRGAFPGWTEDRIREWVARRRVLRLKRLVSLYLERYPYRRFSAASERERERERELSRA